MKTLIFIFLFFLICGTISAQAPDTLWTRTFGGSDWDFGNCVQQTTDGGYIIAGSIRIFISGVGLGDGGAWLIKTNHNGDTLWTKVLTEFGPGAGGKEAIFVQQTTDGGFITTGSIGVDPSTHNRCLFCRKTDGSGSTMWNWFVTDYQFWDSPGNCVQQTTDGDYVVISSLSADVWLLKFADNGDTLWTKTYGGSGNDWGEYVQQTTDGGYIIAGTTESYGAGASDVYLIKTDANGNTLWTKTFGGSLEDGGGSVQQTTDGGYIIAGTTESYGAGGDDVYLIKTDANGNTLWTKTFGGSLNDGGNFHTSWGFFGLSSSGLNVQQTTNGGYIIAGTTESYGAGASDVYLIKVDANGDTLWTKTYGGSGNDWGEYVQQTTDGGYIIAGTTESYGAGASDVWLIKLAPDVTSIDENPQTFINSYQLQQNYPNPFNPTTHIGFGIADFGFVSLKVYDITGREVATLISENLMPGSYKYQWDAQGLASGVYFYRIEAADFTKTRKMLLIR